MILQKVHIKYAQWTVIAALLCTVTACQSSDSANRTTTVSKEAKEVNATRVIDDPLDPATAKAKSHASLKEFGSGPFKESSPPAGEVGPVSIKRSGWKARPIGFSPVMKDDKVETAASKSLMMSPLAAYCSRSNEMVFGGFSEGSNRLNIAAKLLLQPVNGGRIVPVWQTANGQNQAVVQVDATSDCHSVVAIVQSKGLSEMLLLQRQQKGNASVALQTWQTIRISSGTNNLMPRYAWIPSAINPLVSKPANNLSLLVAEGSASGLVTSLELVEIKGEKPVRKSLAAALKLRKIDFVSNQPHSMLLVAEKESGKYVLLEVDLRGSNSSTKERFIVEDGRVLGFDSHAATQKSILAISAEDGKSVDLVEIDGAKSPPEQSRIFSFKLPEVSVQGAGRVVYSSDGRSVYVTALDASGKKALLKGVLRK